MKNVPVISTHDGRTIRYPDPNITVGDTIKIDLESGVPSVLCLLVYFLLIVQTLPHGLAGKVLEHVKLDLGAQVLVTGGRSTGRVGTLIHRERHPGTFDIVHIKDAAGHEVGRLSVMMRCA